MLGKRKSDVVRGAQLCLQKTWKPTPKGLNEIARALLGANGTSPRANKKTRRDSSKNPALKYEETLFKAMFGKGGWYTRVRFSVSPEYFKPICDILFAFAECYLSREKDPCSCEWIFTKLDECIGELQSVPGIDVQEKVSAQYINCIEQISKICTTCSNKSRPPNENETTFI